MQLLATLCLTILRSRLATQYLEQILHTHTYIAQSHSAHAHPNSINLLGLQYLCWERVLGAKHSTQVHQQSVTDPGDAGGVGRPRESGEKPEEPVDAGRGREQREEGQQTEQGLRQHQAELVDHVIVTLKSE